MMRLPVFWRNPWTNGAGPAEAKTLRRCYLLEPAVPLPTVAELVEVARYFRSAMEQRRSIGLRAFFAVTGFDVLVVKAVLDYPQLRAPVAAMVTRLGVVAALVVYLCLVVNIERVNWRSSESYRTIEERLRQRLGDSHHENGFHRCDSGWAAMRASWSGIWPAVAATALGLACFVLLPTL
jgi:hypothetical protein